MLALNFAFGDILAAVLISGLLSWTSWSITLSLDLTPWSLGVLSTVWKSKGFHSHPRSSLGLYRNTINTHTVLTFALRDAQQTHSLVSEGAIVFFIQAGTLIEPANWRECSFVIWHFFLCRKDSFTVIFSLVAFSLSYCILVHFLMILLKV